MTSATQATNDKLTITICKPPESDLDVIENGGLSPVLSVRTDDDACSEIIRIDPPQTPDERPTGLARVVRTFQVSTLSHWSAVVFVQPPPKTKFRALQFPFCPFI